MLHVLTDFELPLYPLHIAVSVLGLDGVTVTHQLHKLFGQDTVLERRKHFGHYAAVLLHGFTEDSRLKLRGRREYIFMSLYMYCWIIASLLAIPS